MSLFTEKHQMFWICVFGDARRTFGDQEKRLLQKDWKDTTRTGYLVGYSETSLGYKLFVSELQTEMICVHWIFNEVIPDRDEEYYKEIDRMNTDIERQNSQQEEFYYLVGTRHIDDEDGLEYVVTRVGKLRWDVVV